MLFWRQVIFLSWDNLQFAKHGVPVLYFEDFANLFGYRNSSARCNFGIERYIAVCCFCRHETPATKGMNVD